MFVERDFLVKQTQINDELRRRALERQMLRATRSRRLQPLRWIRSSVRNLLPVGNKRVPVSTTGTC